MFEGNTMHLKDWMRSANGMTNIKGIHLYLPQYCELNSCHNVKIFLLSSGFSAQIVTHI